LKAFRGWHDAHSILTYGWLKKPNEQPRLVPLTIYTEAREGKHIYWCREHFTDYEMFSVGARIAAN